MATYTLVRGFSRLGDSLSYSVSVTDAEEVVLTPAIATGVTDGLHALTLDQSQIKFVFIVSDKDITLETNSGSVPDDTIVLVANEPVTWIDGDTAACPITADVTGLYVTNTSGATANLKMYFLVDPTV